MPRPARVQFDNACYHVINRGLSRKKIFINDKGYQIFLEIMEEACQRFGVIVHAYCLMDNHYHLLLQTPKGNLSKFMQRVSSRYTQRFNKFTDGDGPLFRGRFKSMLIEDDPYLLVLSRYIHRNPANFIDNLSSYKWSSYPAYLGEVNCPSWLDVKFSLGLFDMDKKKYKKFVETQERPKALVV